MTKSLNTKQYRVFWKARFSDASGRGALMSFDEAMRNIAWAKEYNGDKFEYWLEEEI